MKISHFVLFVMVLSLVIFSVDGLAERDRNSINIQGSSTVLPISQRAAEVFMEKYPHISISVSGGGSGTGIAALVDGVVQIANSSRFIKLDEVKNAVASNIYPVPHRIAMDGIAIVVNNENKVKELSLEQVRKIFTGEITDWSQVGGDRGAIVMVSRDTSSGTFECFYEVVLQGQRLSPRSQLQTSSGGIVSTVNTTKGAIGYVGLGYLDGSVKPLDIIKEDGKIVSPTKENVASGVYPVSRPLFIFTNGWPAGNTALFINFILSLEGQKLVEEVGFVPLY